MKIDYHSSLIQYISFDKLPLGVVRIQGRRHPERKFHNHEFMEIVFILKGNALHVTEKAAFPIQAGDVLIIYPGQVHAFDKTEEMELVNIIYDHRKLPVPLLDGYSLPLFRYFLPDSMNYKDIEQLKVVTNLKGDDFTHIMKLITNLENELTTLKPGNSFCSLIIFMEIIAFISRLNSDELFEHHAHFLIGNAISFMKKNYYKTISIEQLASVAKMSNRNFFRLFKNTIGCTPINYLLRIRLNHASEMLTYSDISISEIALSCGFYDSNYFCRKFKEVRNMTPRQFRLKLTSKS